MINQVIFEGEIISHDYNARLNGLTLKIDGITEDGHCNLIKFLFKDKDVINQITSLPKYTRIVVQGHLEALTFSHQGKIDRNKTYLFGDAIQIK